MDRVFLDANVLFSAAYRPEGALSKLWRLRGVTLCSSRHAIEEARANLPEVAQEKRLLELVRDIEVVDADAGQLPDGVSLPDKDSPILLAAIEARATHLLTGDIRHFGPYMNKRVAGILVQLPGDYLRAKT